MYSSLRFFELKNTKFKTKNHFFTELSKDLEVANFRFLVNVRFLTLNVQVWESRNEEVTCRILSNGAFIVNNCVFFQVLSLCGVEGPQI